METRRGRVLALVLAGGEGGRLGALTEERAKPALPFAGVYRLIDFPLSNCHHSRISDVWVVQQYEAHSLSEYLANGRPWDLDRTYGGLRVVHPSTGDAESGFYEGNADAIHRNREAIQEFAPEHVLVVSADAVYRLDYRAVVEHHQETGAELTVVTTRLADEDAGRFGVVDVDAAGRVRGFAYKPDEPAGNIVATEVFVYESQVLLEALAELAGDGALEDFGHGLVPRLVERGRTRAYELEGYWRDVGTVESYWQAHMELLGDGAQLALGDPAWPVLTRPALQPPARVESGAEIRDSLVSPGCVIRGHVQRSVLGPGTIVERGATVSDAVLLNDVVVERGASVEAAVLDERVYVEAGASVGGTDEIAVVGRRERVSG